MMKAVVINGSPRTDRGYTARLLTPFIQGMAAAGATVELIHASDLNLKPCNCSEMLCWYRTPGDCCIPDDMQMLYPKLRAADTLILATPIYIPLPSDMQTIVNRLCPLIIPLIEFRAGRSRARFRQDVHIRRIAVVAVGGWWERENMDPVVNIAEELAQLGSVEFAGAVLRPHAFLMWKQGEVTPVGEVVLEAVKQAGRELVKDGAMCGETLETISRPLISEEEFRRRYNLLIQGPASPSAPGL